jgi:putative transcriptional regulator
MFTIKPAKGRLLIAEPFLKDPNFIRSVILLCEVQKAGCFGFVINKLADSTLGDLVTGLEHLSVPVYYGGPVQDTTIHFLHTYPEFIKGGFPITENVYWGGDFEIATALITSGEISTEGIRFYLGYSGWEENQLQDELKEGSWVVSKSNKDIIFLPEVEKMWKEAMMGMGGDYKLLVNAPIDPQLN